MFLDVPYGYGAVLPPSLMVFLYYISREEMQKATSTASTLGLIFFKSQTVLKNSHIFQKRIRPALTSGHVSSQLIDMFQLDPGNPGLALNL